MKVVLFRPDIPQNTGNIGRTCVAIGASLGLVRPLGFTVSDKYLKRSGMDYWDSLDLTMYDAFPEAIAGTPREKLFLLSTHGTQCYTDTQLPLDGVYVFGSESGGLSSDIMKQYSDRLFSVPMTVGTRSLNLATTVGIVLYEVVRQNKKEWEELERTRQAR